MKKRTTIPKQKRSQETRQKIKDTAYQLFSEKGYQVVTSNEIAAVARVNIGTFYHYFADKKELLLELLVEFEQRFSEAAFYLDESKLEGIELKDLIGLYLKQSFAALRKETAFFKSVYPLRFSDQDVARFVKRNEQLEVKRIFGVLKSKLGDIDEKEVAKQIEIAHFIVATIVDRYYSFGKSISKKRLIDALTDMLNHYLE